MKINQINYSPMNFVSIWRVALHYGAMSGLLSFLVFLIIYFSGDNPFGKYSWLGAWIPILFIVLAIKYFRETVLAGEIRFVEGLKVGINTVFSASFLFALIVYIFGTLIDGRIVERYKDDAISQLGTAQEVYGEDFMDGVLGRGSTIGAVEQLEETTLYEITFGDFTNKLLGGFLVTLISAWILSRKKLMS